MRNKNKTNNLKVSYGGIAKPLGDNYFLMHGATHEQGGIGIGKDLEVENGEIVKVNPKSVKVLSNAPIMNGISPAQFALDAPGLGILKERFNTGFKYQEAYKDKNNLNDDGTKKAKFGKEKKVDKKLIEDVIRTSGGITGKFLSWKPPFINFGELGHAIKAGLVALGNEKAVAEPNANYTGVAMEGKGIATDNGLGFVSTQDLTDELGETPVDFVDTYVTGETPFAKQGVIKKYNAEEKRLFKSKLKRTGMQDIQVFQTYKDTLDANTLAALEKQLADGKYTYSSQNTTYKDSPFRIGDTGLIYDGNNSTIIRTVLPDGRVFYKANDIFDTNKKEWNYKVGPLAKWGLNFIDENTTPFMMTTPWYQGKADSDTWRRMRDMFGIDFDENGKLINQGDSNGKIWDIEEALQWIDEHPYEVDYEAVNDPNYKKLGGEMKNKSNKRGISSTGERKKANNGGQFKLNFRPTTFVGKTSTFNPKLTLNVPQFGVTKQIPNYITGEIKTPWGTKNIVTGQTTYGLAGIDGKGSLIKPQTPPKTVDSTEFGDVSVWDANPNLGMEIGNFVGNIGATIATGLVNRSMLNDLSYRPKPSILYSGKLKTDVDITSPIRAIKNQSKKYIDLIDNNTASSQVAINRKKGIYSDALDKTLDLFSTRENTRTGLINQDIANQQGIINQNITNYDNWLAGKTDFMNTIREQKSENTVSAIQNSAQSLGDFITNQAQWRKDMMNIAALSAAYPNVTPERLMASGIPYPLYMKQKALKGKRRR